MKLAQTKDHEANQLPDSQQPMQHEQISDHEIAEVAYFKAESRDFEPGYELSDWLEAERELRLS